MEGLVTVVPQRGAVVTALSEEDATDLYEMRACLESLAVQRFVQRADTEQVAQLRAAVIEIERTSSAPDPVQQLCAKDEFYRVLFTGSASQPLQQTLASLQARAPLLQATSLSEPGWPARAAAELRAAANACALDIRNAARTTLARLHID